MMAGVEDDVWGMLWSPVSLVAGGARVGGKPYDGRIADWTLRPLFEKTGRMDPDVRGRTLPLVITGAFSRVVAAKVGCVDFHETRVRSLSGDASGVLHGPLCRWAEEGETSLAPCLSLRQGRTEKTASRVGPSRNLPETRFGLWASDGGAASYPS